MNVVLEEQPNCEVILKVEVPVERVDLEWKSITGDFARQAKVPGYRPGKAPRSLIESKYSREIKEELTNKLLRTTINEAIKEKGLRVLSVSKVEEVELGADRIFRYKALVITSPEFELPPYEGLEITLAEPSVGDADLQQALDRIREPHATYEPVEGRGLAMGDYAVITYETQLDGQLLKEALPKAPPLLQGRQNFWLEMTSESFLPGFCEQLVGLKPEDSKTFSLTFQDNFPFADLRGKSPEFSVTLHAINSKSLPEWDDDLAARIAPDKTFEEIKELVRTNLETSGKQDFESRKRNLAVGALLEKVNCELPGQIVQQEMTGVLRDIVQENQGRGVSEEELRQHESELVGMARQTAEQRVRSQFVLLRIAEKEKLQVTEQELITQVMQMANRYEIPVKKLVKDLQRRNAIESLREQLLAAKALDLVTSKVVVRPPTA